MTVSFVRFSLSSSCGSLLNSDGMAEAANIQSSWVSFFIITVWLSYFRTSSQHHWTLSNFQLAAKLGKTANPAYINHLQLDGCREFVILFHLKNSLFSFAFLSDSRLNRAVYMLCVSTESVRRREKNTHTLTNTRIILYGYTSKEGKREKKKIARDERWTKHNQLIWFNNRRIRTRNSTIY